MRRSKRLLAPGLAAIFAAGLLATLFATSALGATPRRTWQAGIGGAGAAGFSTLLLYPSMDGSLSVTIGGLKPNTTYGLVLYTGTCAQPRVVVKLPGLRTNEAGNVAKATSITADDGRRIWGTAYNHALAIRLASGTERHCGTLTYPVATRIAISKYGIDLPIVKQIGQAYPLCNVALYATTLSQPGEAGEGLVFAHARTGMFLPLLNASIVRNGAAMVGATVQIWKSDSTVLTYRIWKVLRHSYVLPTVSSISEHLFLQTSEGPHGTPNKLLIELSPAGSATATYAAAHPTPHPVKCGP